MGFVLYIIFTLENTTKEIGRKLTKRYYFLQLRMNKNNHLVRNLFSFVWILQLPKSVPKHGSVCLLIFHKETKFDEPGFRFQSEYATSQKIACRSATR